MEWYEWATLVVGNIIIAVWAYFYLLKNWFDGRKAEKEIFAFVKAYKLKCTGANRFVVTVETLQDSFREYDTQTILKVWLKLVDQRVIVTDPEDQVWCVR